MPVPQSSNLSSSIDQWHERFVQQASWTNQLRHFLYHQVDLESATRILDVGCGTGALIPDFFGFVNLSYIGLDLDYERVSFARSQAVQPALLNADAFHLPLAPNTFDCVLCHYLLLWLSDPVPALKEMHRVLKRGGHVLILAEPDYSSRIDEPPELQPLGLLQTRSLQKQGASTANGRKLPSLLKQAGFRSIQYGCSGFQQQTEIIPIGWNLEWEIIKQDLQGILTQPEIDRYQQIDRQSWLEGSRVLWVPTFYAYGIKY
jgi:SAM-dependent methyltransferase